jgi:hypothetical protein
MIFKVIGPFWIDPKEFGCTIRYLSDVRPFGIKKKANAGPLGLPSGDGGSAGASGATSPSKGNSVAGGDDDDEEPLPGGGLADKLAVMGGQTNTGSGQMQRCIIVTGTQRWEDEGSNRGEVLNLFEFPVSQHDLVEGGQVRK